VQYTFNSWSAPKEEPPVGLRRRAAGRVRGKAHVFELATEIISDFLSLVKSFLYKNAHAEHPPGMGVFFVQNFLEVVKMQQQATVRCVTRNVSLPATLDRWLVERARREDKPISRVVRRILEKEKIAAEKGEEVQT